MKRSIFIVLAAQPWSGITIDGVPLVVPPGSPDWYVAAFDTREAAERWAGGKPVIEATYDDGKPGPRGGRKKR